MGSWFLWNGVDSRSMGLIVTQAPPQVFPEERVEQVTVLGRPGVLLVPEGVGVYSPYIKTIGIANRRTVSFRELAAWLRGSGQLVISTEPGYAYEARILSEALAERVFLQNFSGPVDFLVQPLKAQYPEEPARILGDEPEGSADVVHQGDVPARPVYTLEGTGELILDVGDASDSGAGSRIVVDVGENGDGCVIDTDAGTVTNLDGTESLTASTELYYNGFRGLWLHAGETTTVAWGENVNKVIMEPRWRWL